ncbi:hypothetical protein Q2941_24350 [Bradyrhizobium sp. UFLA05-153]|uniref:hypothetical protein n=1 Tax=Bradyrhizobium sp. Ec3.3 TaxID=189753 RepID=UPI0012EC3246|nr:hypothetical protein [Bradyrhizobium sp. Ec3.3]
MDEAERERMKRCALALDRVATVCQKGSLGMLILLVFFPNWPAGFTPGQVFVSFVLYQLASLVLYHASQRIIPEALHA